MDRLLHRVEGQESRSGVHGTRSVAGPGLVREDLGQGVEGELAQACALGREPVLERPLLDAKTLEEVTPVQSESLLEALDGAANAQALEGLDVDLDGGRVEGEGV